MIHGAVRWKRWSWSTSGAICGTNWIALAPVPITATRLPAKSKSWSHSAEWKLAPLKSSSPGTSAYEGFDRPPIPLITTRAVMVSSPFTVTFQSPVSSSQARARDRRAEAQVRAGADLGRGRARGSRGSRAGGANMRVHSGLGAKENE